ncbi:hypothetical protein DPMN_088162 [Dreissena polymorpha]|uniref:Uncharacterized protein n=1 Tax=Dreissena polymorpha TaxID=45954 RepID=A0A9D4KTM3_DREPO|nr:hypothetical protein DPMN_088162 [Dreissena polymorpha]
MRGPSGQTSLPSFRRSGSPTPRDNRDFRLLLWGNGAKYGPVSVPSATLSPEAVALRRHIATFGMRGPSGQTSLPSFVALGHLLREIIRDFRLLLWGNGANTGQLAYLRRHFHRKRWH